MMAYGREMLRKAGSAFMDFDRAYADAVHRPGMDRVTTNTQAIPFSDFVGGGINVKDEGGIGIPGLATGGPRIDAINQFMADAPYIAANAGVRYGLPAAGITLAGKGLYDMTAMFGNGADYPEQGQLPL